MLLTEDERVFAEAGQQQADLVWTGRPASGLRFRPADVLFVPFSLLWGGFAIVWESVAVMSGPWFMRLWGVPFVLVGLYLIAGRFLWDAYVRSRTWYAVTADAALIYRKNPGGGLQRIYLPSVSNISLKRRDDGFGSILFNENNNAGSYGWQRWAAPSEAFEFIPNAQAVYDLCARAQRATRVPPT